MTREIEREILKEILKEIREIERLDEFTIFFFTLCFILSNKFTIYKQIDQQTIINQ